MKLVAFIQNRKIRRLFEFPQSLYSHFLLLIPLIASQFFQRMFHIIDNRFVGILGSDALLIHNVQYNFILLGQLMSVATTTSMLVFWKRKEAQGKQGSLFLIHFLSALILSFLCAVVFFVLRSHLAEHFEISSYLLQLTKQYFIIGIINMVLQCIYGSIEGSLIATGKTKYCMFFSALLVAGNLVLDFISIQLFFTQENRGIGAPLFSIGLSTTFLLLLVISIGIVIIKREADGWKRFPIKDILPVWSSEIGIAFVRSLLPLIYIYQLALIHASRGFIVSYQLTLHLAYLFCLPVGAGLQIAVSNASKAQSEEKDNSQWFNVFFYTALLPTFFLLLFGALIPLPLIKILYNYEVPADHFTFIPVYFYACIVGQIGHVFSIPIRARKRNLVMTKNFLISEAGVLIGITQILIWLKQATPATICWATMAFTATYLFLNSYSLRKILKNEQQLRFIESASV